MSTAANNLEPKLGATLNLGSNSVPCSAAFTLSPSAIFATANKAEQAGQYAQAINYWRLAGATAGYFSEYCQLLKNNIARVASGSDTEAYLRYLTPKLPKLKLTSTVYAQELAKLKSVVWPEGLADAIATTEQHTTSCIARLSLVNTLPLVSIIMPTYNRAAVITQAISTVLEQYYGHFELLVCDDASTDDTAAQVKAFDDKRIRYLKLAKGGAAAARNAGLAQAKGQVIAYLDSDNFWHPAFLLHMLDKLLFTADSHAVYCHFIDYKVLATAPLSAAKATELMVRPFQQPSFCYERLQQRNFIDLNCYIHWRYLFELHGGFNEQLTRRQDYELILRYSWAKAPTQLKQVLALYRRDERLLPITYQQQHDHSCNQHIANTLAQLKQATAQTVTAHYLLLADQYNTCTATEVVACAKLLSHNANVSVLWLSGPRQRFWPELPANIKQVQLKLAQSHYQLQQPQQWLAHIPKDVVVINFSSLPAAIMLSALVMLRQQTVLLSDSNTTNNMLNKQSSLLGQFAHCTQATWPFAIEQLKQQATVTQTPIEHILTKQLLLACQRQRQHATLLIAPFVQMLTRQWQLQLGIDDCQGINQC